jgi:hypothetical protein
VCPLASGADAIVVALRPDGVRVPDLLAAHGCVHGDAALYLDLSPDDAQRLPVPAHAVLLDRSAPAAEVVNLLRCRTVHTAPGTT